MSPLVHRLVLMIGLALDGCGPVAQAQEKMTKIPEHLYSSPPLRSEEIPPPAPVSGQDRRQLDQAVAAGSSAALVMFLSRFPDSSLVPEARADLKSRVKPDPEGVTRQVAESDAEVVMAFDRARLSGDSAQVSAFIAQYAPHPLTIEARHLPY